MKDTFAEEYQIRYNYQKPDGFWVYGAITNVFVDVKHGVNERNNHDQAKKIFQKENPKAVIKMVSYC